MLGTYLGNDDDEKEVYRPPPLDVPPIEPPVVRPVDAMQMAPTRTAHWTPMAIYSHLGWVGIQDSTHCEFVLVDRYH
ncbi:hypothetical protein J1N35_044107 [Gossypium stocksii]|uniref:Uncharacterized protein n=1 Tax=Gossypium stocksii TaxID=47602 RepID=A0A9D3U8H7_9ROSI|nr:hypothetical protein J1N35_044107 [Gossypium stocksii]